MRHILDGAGRLFGRTGVEGESERSATRGRGGGGSDEIPRGGRVFKDDGARSERRTHYFSTHGTLVVAIIVVRALWFLPGPASASRV